MKYVVLKRKGGWGDRIFQIAEALRYCKETNRILVIDFRHDIAYSDYLKDGIIKNTFDSYFELEDENYLLDLPPSHGDNYIPDFWNRDRVYNYDFADFRGEFIIEDYFVRLYAKGKKILYDEDVVMAIEISYPVIYDNIEKSKMIKDFNIKLKRNVVDIADKFCEENDIENLIGVHARWSPLFDDWSDRDTDLKFPAKGLIATFKIIKGEKVFLATDSWRIKKMFSDVTELVDYKKHTKLSEIEDWDEMFWLHSIPYLDREKMGLEALVDCLILSRCKEFIPVNKLSQFSKLAKIFRVKGL